MAVRNQPRVCGDAFAIGAQADSRAGTLSDDHGNSMIACPADLMTALRHTLNHECGPGAGTVLRAIGRRLGENLAERINCDLAKHHAASLEELPTASVHAALSSALASWGWGRATWDWERHDRGLLEITVENGPAAGEPLLCGLFAGLVSHLTGETLDCVQTDSEIPGVAPARFVVSLPERLATAADAARRGESHDRIIALLETVRV